MINVPVRATTKKLPVQFSLNRRFGLMTTALGGLGSILLTAILLLAYACSGEQTFFLIMLITSLFIPLFFVASTYSSLHSYLFSAGFWLAVTIGFYIILKAVAMLISGNVVGLNLPLAGVLLFLMGCTISLTVMQFWQWRTLSTSTGKSCHTDQPIGYLSPIGVAICGFGFFLLKALALVAFFRVSYGQNVLEVNSATQGGGAAYIYRLLNVSNIFYLFLAVHCYKTRKFTKLFCIATAWIFADAVISSGRYQIIITIFWNAFLYHRYISPIKLRYLFLVTPALVTIISFFAITRGEGIGKLTVILDAAKYLLNNSAVIFEIFMARMDMLPQMAQGFYLHSVNRLPDLYGMSGIYAFLHAIPRPLWPDKPPLTAALVTEKVMPGAYNDGVLIYPSFVLEGLLNLGWSGIFLAGIFTGVACFFYDKAAQSRSIVAVVWSLVFFTFPMGLLNEGIHSNFTANLIYISFLFTVIVVALMMTKSLLRTPDTAAPIRSWSDAA